MIYPALRDGPSLPRDGGRPPLVQILLRLVKRSVGALAGILVLSAVGATVWIFSLPDKAECRASGRVVDPTERHCESASGYQQLEEHAFFHATEVGFVVVTVLVAAFVIHRLFRRMPREGRIG